MYTFILVIHVIVSLFLIFVILMQKGRGEGLADAFGGGSSQTTIFGTRAGTFLTRATTASAIIFMVTCILLTVLSSLRGLSIVDKAYINEQVKKQMEKTTTPTKSQAPENAAATKPEEQGKK